MWRGTTEGFASSCLFCACEKHVDVVIMQRPPFQSYPPTQTQLPQFLQAHAHLFNSIPARSTPFPSALLLFSHLYNNTNRSISAYVRMATTLVSYIIYNQYGMHEKIDTRLGMLSCLVRLHACMHACVSESESKYMFLL